MDIINFRRLTQAEYTAITEKDPETLYIITDDHTFRLGNNPINYALAGALVALSTRVTDLETRVTALEGR